MNRIIPISPDSFNLFRLDFSDWQVLKYLDTACCCPSSTSHCEDHGRQLLWDLFLFDLYSYTLQVRIAVLDIKVFVRAVAVQKRGANTHLHYELAQAFEKINCAGHPCVFPEGYQSIIFVICYFLIVNQADIFLQERIKSRHIVQLSLNKNCPTLIV